MKRTTLQWLGLTAAAAVFATGCVARPLAPRPGPGTAPTAPNTSSTTGDADACAVALGNAVETGVTGYTGGVGPSTTAGAPAGPAAGPTGPGGVAGAPGTTTGPAGVAGAPGTTTGPTGVAGAPGTTTGVGGVAGAPGTTTGARHEVTANGVLIGNVALVALPTADDLPVTPGAPAAVPGAPTAPGAVGGPAGGTVAGTPGGTNVTAVDRVRAACTKVAEIRVVNDSADRRRLAEVAMSIRRGQPITDFMDDLVRINRRATTVAAGAAAPGAGAGGMAPGTTTAPASP